MANIIQQPGLIEMAIGPLPITLSGLNVNNKRYVLGIRFNFKSFNEEIILKQNKNPSGNAIFNISSIVEDVFKEIQPNIEVSNRVNITNTGLKYFIRSGEEIANNSIVWDSIFPTAPKYLINGIKEPFLINWFGSTQGIKLTSLQGWLTNNPDIVNFKPINIKLTDHYTISWINYNATDNLTLNDFNAQPWAIRYIFYRNNFTTNVGEHISTLYSSPEFNRTTCTANLTSTPNFDNIVSTLGVGPLNDLDNFTPIRNLISSFNATEYEVQLVACSSSSPSIANCNTPSLIRPFLGTVLLKQRFKIDAADCSNFTPYQVSFLNTLGGIDYFTFTKRNTRNISIERSIIFRPYGDFSSATYQVDPGKRGLTTANTNLTDNYELSSDWLSNEESIWLQELFTSPYVKININGNWQSCILLNTSYEEKTIARNNKLFRHEIRITLSSPKRVQK